MILFIPGYLERDIVELDVIHESGDDQAEPAEATEVKPGKILACELSEEEC
jgi:hypothetical protein